MKVSFTTKAKVGLTIVIALAIFAISIVSVGTRQKLFTRSHHYYVKFSSVAGLQTGAPVQLHGVHIGSIKDVNIITAANEKPQVLVHFSIERRYTPLIRTDTVAQLKTMGLLGDKYVLLSSENDPKATELPPGSTVRAIELFDYDALLRQSEDIMTNVAIISSSLRQLLLGLEKGETLLGKLFSDPDFGTELMASFENTVGHWEDISGKVQSGQGLLGRLISDEAYAEQITKDIENILARIDRIAQSTEEGKNLMGQLFLETRDAEIIYQNLKTFIGNLHIISDEMKQGKGFIPSLLQDSEESRDMIISLHSALQSFSSILEKLDKGEGSAGAFLNDESVYTAIKDIVGAMEKSKTTKWYLRKKRKEGEKLREKEDANVSEEKSAADDNPKTADAVAVSDKEPSNENAPVADKRPQPEAEVAVIELHERDPFVKPAPPPR